MHKDIYDLYYYGDKLNAEKMKICFDTYIFNDSGMRENDMNDIIHRVKSVFSNTAYKSRVDNSDKRWLDDDIDVVFEGIMKSLNLIGIFFR